MSQVETSGEGPDLRLGDAGLDQRASNSELQGRTHSRTIVTEVIQLGAVDEVRNSSGTGDIREVCVKLVLAQVTSIGGIRREPVIGKLVCLYHDVLDAEAAGELSRTLDRGSGVERRTGCHRDQSFTERVAANREQKGAVDSTGESQKSAAHAAQDLLESSKAFVGVFLRESHPP
jgi:hypothetical protein